MRAHRRRGTVGRPHLVPGREEKTSSRKFGDPVTSAGKSQALATDGREAGLRVLRVLSSGISLGRDGAQGRTRTGTGCPTRPSNVRVYQFRHLGPKNTAAS